MGLTELDNAALQLRKYIPHDNLLYQRWNISQNDQNEWAGVDVLLTSRFFSYDLIHCVARSDNVATLPSLLNRAAGLVVQRRGSNITPYFISDPLIQTTYLIWSCQWSLPRTPLLYPNDQLHFTLPPADADATPTGDYLIEFLFNVSSVPKPITPSKGTRQASLPVRLVGRP